MTILIILLYGLVGAGVGLLVSRLVTKAMPGGSCPILCNPKISAGYFALMGMLMAGN